MRKKSKSILLALALSIIVASSVFAGIPLEMTFQGQLKDSGGNPVGGQHNVTFSLYDNLNAGNLLWQEPQNVTFSDGLFTVFFGQDINNPLNLDFGRQYWLGMSIDGGNELSPRTPLAAGAFSFRARYVDLLTEENIQQFWTLAATMPDADGDGHTKVTQGGDDCDDFNPNIHPGADEICDGIDNDCDGIIDDNTVNCPEGTICYHAVCVTADADGDGYNVDVDCDDNNPYIHPGQPESCNGVDDNCDGVVDNNVIDCPSGYACLNGQCVPQDNDGDGWPSDIDCDDNNPSVYPGALEICYDFIDNNCDGQVDEDCR